MSLASYLVGMPVADLDDWALRIPVSIEIADDGSSAALVAVSA
jgi:hypothetical protein